MKKLLLSTILGFTLASSVYAEGGDILRATFMADELEYQFSDIKTISWDTNAYLGYDINKVYLYSEGEKAEGSSSMQSENQIVYSRAIAPYWDIQLGLDYDTNEGEDATWGVLALSGLSPYFFKIRAVFLLDNNGNIGVRTDIEYEALITQKLILTPSLEVDAYTKDNVEMGLGKGISSLVLGARLRYEIVREFAPYIGIEWSKNFGNTNDYVPLDEIYATAGLRFWF